MVYPACMGHICHRNPPPQVVVSHLLTWVLKTPCARESQENLLGTSGNLNSAAVIAATPQNI